MRFPSYQWREISLIESYKLRALAILMIIIHNFLHLIMNSPGENEFYYSADKYRAFVEGLWNRPIDGIRIIFSYLGHYGVQVFFFLSGYGAFLKLNSNQTSWASYVKRRLLSFYVAITLAAIGFLIYFSYRDSISETFADHGIKLIKQMFGIANFEPNNVYRPIGPWWFIGVIVQFYLIAPLLFKIPLMNTSKRPLILGFIALGSLISEYYLTELFHQKLNCNFNHTILGHLDICALGMLGAHYKKIKIPLWIFITALIMFVFGNWWETMWIAAAFWMTILLVPLFRIFSDKLSKIQLFDYTLIYLGQISVYIFLCNGYLRKPLLNHAKHDPTWSKSLYLCSEFILFVILWATCLYWIEKILRCSLTHLINAKNG